MAANTVGRDLKAVFKESYSPTDERYLPQRNVLVFQVAVPGKSHKDVGDQEKNNGKHEGSLSHSQVGRRFQRRAAHAADHGRAVATGERVSDFAGAGGAIKRVMRLRCGIFQRLCHGSMSDSSSQIE